MEQRNDLPRNGIDRCEVRSLVEITTIARKRQVVSVVDPAVLSGNDVFDVESEIDRVWGR